MGQDMNIRCLENYHPGFGCVQVLDWILGSSYPDGFWNEGLVN
jgi:hypothetical protein